MKFVKFACFRILFSAYLLPKVFYGEQIQLGMEGAFLSDDNNDTTNQLTIKLMGGSRAIDVSVYCFNERSKNNLKNSIDLTLR